MSTNDRIRKEPDAQAITNKPHIGHDADGRDHYLDQVRQTVYVLDGHQIVHREDVQDASLAEWVAYVDHRIGWVDLHWAPDEETLLDRAGVPR